ncbi:MAG: hypothetical protein IKZ88_02990 [Neisseriaceae bacterium]|nr:hypothetical protein [Neisseriaceae bacterium]
MDKKINCFKLPEKIVEVLSKYIRQAVGLTKQLLTTHCSLIFRQPEQLKSLYNITYHSITLEIVIQ